MTDRFSKEVRSRIMSSIGSKDTGPEMVVRRTLWASGFRYRVHNRSVLGTPDISNKKRRLAIFVDGCFWHGCSMCYKEPKTNVDFWREKIRRNRARREAVCKGLEEQGYRVVEIWEHEVNDSEIIVGRVSAALES